MTPAGSASDPRPGGAWRIENENELVVSVPIGGRGVVAAALVAETLLAGLYWLLVVTASIPAGQLSYAIPFLLIGGVILLGIPWLGFGRFQIRISQSHLSLRRSIGPLFWTKRVRLGDVQYVRRIDREYEDSDHPHASVLTVVCKNAKLPCGFGLSQAAIDYLWADLAIRFRAVRRIEEVQRTPDLD